MKNLYRLLFALFYLLGWVIHVYLGIWSPETYNGFSQTIIFPPFQWIWSNVIIPNSSIFALLLAAVELTTGLLMVSKGKWVKIGVALSLVFNVCLVFLGLANPSDDQFLDFLQNRLPMLIFVAAQVPLLWIKYERSLPEDIRQLFKGLQKSAAN